MWMASHAEDTQLNPKWYGDNKQFETWIVSKESWWRHQGLKPPYMVMW